VPNLRIPLIVAGSLAGVFVLARLARARDQSSDGVDGIRFPKSPNKRIVVFTDGQKMFEVLRDKRLPVPKPEGGSDYTPNWDQIVPSRTLVIVGDNDTLMQQAMNLAAQAVTARPLGGGGPVHVFFASCAVADDYARAEGFSEFQIGAGGDCQTLVMYQSNDLVGTQEQLSTSAEVISKVPSAIQMLSSNAGGDRGELRV